MRAWLITHPGSGRKITVTILVVIVLVVLFTGGIDVICTETEIDISPTYYTHKTVSLDEISEIEYCEDFEEGTRTAGFGSFRLQLGNFNNKEFGKYLLFKYTACDSCVIIKTQKKTIVVNAKTKEDTESLLQEIQDHYNEFKSKNP